METLVKRGNSCWDMESHWFEALSSKEKACMKQEEQIHLCVREMVTQTMGIARREEPCTQHELEMEDHTG